MAYLRPGQRQKRLAAQNRASAVVGDGPATASGGRPLSGQRKGEQKNRESLSSTRDSLAEAEGKLPIYSTSYIDLLMEGPGLQKDAIERQVEYKRGMSDLGVRIGKDDRVRGYNRGSDKYDPYSAWAQGKRSALFSSGNRGFGNLGAMRGAAFQPIKQDIKKSATRSRADLISQNQNARKEWYQRRQIKLQGVPTEAAGRLMEGKK